MILEFFFSLLDLFSSVQYWLLSVCQKKVRRNTKLKLLSLDWRGANGKSDHMMNDWNLDVVVVAAFLFSSFMEFPVNEFFTDDIIVMRIVVCSILKKSAHNFWWRTSDKQINLAKCWTRIVGAECFILKLWCPVSRCYPLFHLLENGIFPRTTHRHSEVWELKPFIRLIPVG